MSENNQQLNNILHAAARDMERAAPSPSFSRLWLKARLTLLRRRFLPDDILIPATALATVVVLVAGVSSVVQTLKTPMLEKPRIVYIEKTDISTLEEIWQSPTDTLLQIDSTELIGARIDDGNLIEADDGRLN